MVVNQSMEMDFKKRASNTISCILEIVMCLILEKKTKNAGSKWEVKT